MQAIILAGGKGTRLKPFTNIIPKPLVPIGDLSILEIILRQLKYHGVNHITIAVNHLAKLIEAFFGNGEPFSLNIEYSLENKILGTAGPVKLVKNLKENFLVMNGDILTTINYNDFYQYHLKQQNDITIATYKKEVNIDLGVLVLENSTFKDYIEKPTYSFIVSMGIYVINRKVIELIPDDKKYDLPDLVKDSQRNGFKIGSYSGDYEWLDIGRFEDYEKAIEVFEQNRHKYLLDN